MKILVAILLSALIGWALTWIPFRIQSLGEDD